MTRYFFESLAMLGCLLPLAAMAGWPEIPFPEGARVASIGEQTRLNGVPMRMFQVSFKQRAEQSIHFYRDRLGQKLAEEILPGGEHILAQARGDYFITLRIRPVSLNTSTALVSISDVRAAKEASNRPLGFNLPAGSRVLSDLESTDAGKRSRQLVFQNRLDQETNRDALARELIALGYRPDSHSAQKQPGPTVLYYQGDKREARLTLVRKDGLTQAVLTTIRTP